MKEIAPDGNAADVDVCGRHALFHQLRLCLRRTDKICVGMRHNPFVLCADVGDIGVKRDICAAQLLIGRDALRADRECGNHKLRMAVQQQPVDFLRDDRLHRQDAAASGGAVEEIVHGGEMVDHVRKCAVNHPAQMREQVVHEIDNLYLCLRIDGQELLANRFRRTAVPHSEAAG